MKLFALAIAIAPAVLAFAPAPSPTAARARRADVGLDMAASSTTTTTRRDAVSEIASGLLAAVASSASVAATPRPAAAAEPGAVVALEPLRGTPTDNEVIKGQRTVTDRLDINNAPVADYMRYPGLYPAIGGKIANGGPYGSVKELYGSGVLSKDEVRRVRKYEGELTATPATGLDTLRGRDPYRRSFNR